MLLNGVQVSTRGRAANYMCMIVGKRKRIYPWFVEGFK